MPRTTRHGRGLTRSPQARHDEAVGLAMAIDLEPVHTAIVTIADPRPATLIGTGKVEETRRNRSTKPRPSWSSSIIR